MAYILRISRNNINVTFAECVLLPLISSGLFSINAWGTQKATEVSRAPISCPWKKGKSHPENPQVYYCTYIEGTASQPLEDKGPCVEWSHKCKRRPTCSFPDSFFPSPLLSSGDRSDRWTSGGAMTGRSLNEFTCLAVVSPQHNCEDEEPVFARHSDDATKRRDGETTYRVQGLRREAPRLIGWRRGRVVLSRARALRAKTFPRHAAQLHVIFLTINFVITRKKRPWNSVFRIAIDIKP